MPFLPTERGPLICGWPFIQNVNIKKKTFQTGKDLETPL